MGRVKSTNRYSLNNRIINQFSVAAGYRRVKLYKNGVSKCFLVHRLVAQSFMPNPHNHNIVNHKDEDPTNNQIDNLEWCTQKYNVTYGTGNIRNTFKKYKRVKMLNEKGEYMKTFNSIQEASSHTGVFATNISRAIKRNWSTTKKGKTYKWSF